MTVQRVLMLAPQPLFEERGTPIAVRMLLEAIAKPAELEFDLLSYAPGAELTLPGVTHLRISHLPWTKTIRPGLSVSKLCADFLLLIKTLTLLASKPRGFYTHLHAVEESVFIALICRWIWGIKYVYDMDSSLADQVIEKLPWLRFSSGVLLWLEKIAIRNSRCTVAVCQSLLERAQQAGAPQSELLSDVSLLGPVNPAISLRSELNIPESKQVALYVGNLEPYQGVDLLIESWAKVCRDHLSWNLVILGGASKTAITQYQEKAQKVGAERVYLPGPRPVTELASYLAAADLLVSPRITGNNTPMKIYSYLHAGKPILATDLPTHRQVLTDEISILAAHSCFAAELSRVISDATLRARLANAAARFAATNCTREVFEARALYIYRSLLQ